MLSLEAFHILEFGGPSRMSEADIIELSGKSVAKAPGADGVVISCGGLRTLGVHKPLEERHGLPVVSSTPAAFWAAMRLVGESGHVARPRPAAGTGGGPCALNRSCAWTSRAPTCILPDESRSVGAQHRTSIEAEPPP